MVGAPFVSFSWSSLKDYEKFDLSDVPDAWRKIYSERRSACRRKGWRSSEDGTWTHWVFNDEVERKESIQIDLRDTM